MAKPEKELISFRVDSEKKEALDALASLMDRDRTYVLNEAVEAYLDLHQWQIEQIRKGLKEADENQFTDEKAVESFFEKWTDAH